MQPNNSSNRTKLKHKRKHRPFELAGKETSPLRVRWHKKQAKARSCIQEDRPYRSHVTHLIYCLRDAYGFRGYSRKVIDKVTVTLEERIGSLIEPEKFFKWFYGNTLAWGTSSEALRNETIDRLVLDSTDVFKVCKLFGGKLYMFLKRLFRRLKRHSIGSNWNRRRSALIKLQTFLMMKKGSPTVSEKLVKEADLKHKAALGNYSKSVSHVRRYKNVEVLTLASRITEQPINTKSYLDVVPEWDYERLGGWGDFEVEYGDPYQLEKKIKNQVIHLVAKLFKPGSFSHVLRRERTLFPSSSAHSDTKTQRSQSGAVNRIRQYFSENVLGELAYMTYHPRVGTRSHYFIDYPDAPDAIAADILNNKFLAQPVYLREPLKVRTITKGPSTPYWFFKPIQQFLWSRLQTHPIFELIGKPISSDILNKMVNMQGYWVPNAKWLSGDYSAATDNLVGWLSEFIWNEICLRTGIPEPIRIAGIQGLTHHLIQYKDVIMEQKNGQLMGSPLSFPILCIANATICMLAFAKKRRQRMDCLPLRINGDDCIMYYTERERRRWYSYSAFIGMSPSPGKCYYASDWLQMNSELFVLRKSGFRHINFINFSLASPYLAKGGAERNIKDLSAAMTAFCWGRGPKFINIWLRRMTPFLKRRIPKLISWFLPKCLGGLGLISSKPSGSLFSLRQLKVATTFYDAAINGEISPYQLNSVKGGSVSFRMLKQLKKLLITIPIFEERRPVREMWFDRFVKEKHEEASITPLLWESIIKGRSCRVTKVTPLKNPLTNSILSAFSYKKLKKVRPKKLDLLLTLKGVEYILPSQALKSEYEPKSIFLDVTATLADKDKGVLLHL